MGFHASIRRRPWRGRIPFSVCGSSPPEGRFIFINHSSISGRWPGGVTSPAEPHPQSPVSISQQVFSLLKGRLFCVCNVCQKTSIYLPVSNLIMLFADDDFNFSFFFIYRLRPVADPRSSMHSALGNGSACAFKGREKGKKKRRKKFVSCTCTNRSGTCGPGDPQGNDRETYCRWVEESDPVACCSRGGFV